LRTGSRRRANNTVPLLELSSIEKLREEELEEARALQCVMMPAESLRAGAVTISHAFQPAAAVGGDFLDYFKLSDGTVGLYVGDVSGKGLPAALYAALTVGTLRGIRKTGTSPGEVLAILNQRLMIRSMPRRYTTIQYALFDPHTRALQIASAGIFGPFHLSGADCHMLDVSAVPPGLFAGTCYEMTTLQLQPGDSVLFCTDGLTEAFDRHGEQFGSDRLRDLCRSHFSHARSGLLTSVFEAVAGFSCPGEIQDDMAATLFHFAG
jgi:sigma-B regulation protein RsbU (phosphoserine phosphatase)